MTGKQRRQAWNALHVALILVAAFVMLKQIAWIFLAWVYQLQIFFTPTLENFGTRNLNRNHRATRPCASRWAEVRRHAEHLQRH